MQKWGTRAGDEGKEVTRVWRVSWGQLMGLGLGSKWYDKETIEKNVSQFASAVRQVLRPDERNFKNVKRL